MKNTDVKSVLMLAVCYLGMFAFSFIPGTLFNYGYDYLQYIDLPVSILFAISLLILYYFSNKINLPHKLLWVLPPLCLILFWVFRTRVHLFGADGASAALPLAGFDIWDFIPHGKRLETWGSGALFKLLNRTKLFEISPVLPSILATQIYCVIFGVVFVSIICRTFRTRPLLALVILTMPAMLNLFGNIDSYPFSLCYEALFISFLIWLNKSEITFKKLLLSGLIWGIGLWIHPFHAFDGFMIIWFGVEWLKGKWSKCPSVFVFFVIYAIILFIGIGQSGHTNYLFTENDLRKPALSITTLSHWVNQMALPLMPLFIVLLFNSKSLLLVIPVLTSVLFFILGFTQGAVDQFCYQHLVFILSVPLIVALAKTKYTPPRRHFLFVIFVNLFLLIPMVFVHGGNLTIKRALRLYPIDLCHHNRVMSWQTHLTIALGDNLQPDPEIRKALLATAYNGARFAEPAGFRGGNYCYYVAWHYHFGLFERGSQLLSNLLRNNPDTVRMFLGERPAFTYLNRDRLWRDVERYFPARNDAERNALKQAIQNARNHAVKNPYTKYFKTP